jgi:hypothetical protein
MHILVASRLQSMETYLIITFLNNPNTDGESVGDALKPTSKWIKLASCPPPPYLSTDPPSPRCPSATSPVRIASGGSGSI